MQKAVFKTFAVTEGLMTSFLALMLALQAKAIQPSQNAKELTRRLRNNEEVSCCELKSEYRKMALELHPDKGGSDEDMVLLNNARDSRKDCSKQKMRGCSQKSSTKSSKGTKSKSSTKSSKGKSSKGTKSKSSTKSSKGTKKTKERSVDKGRLFAGGVLAGGVVANAMGKRKSHKTHVRNPTSPRHK